MNEQPRIAIESKPFRLEEATIDELHAAIQAGQTTCVAVVQHYIDARARLQRRRQRARHRGRRAGPRGDRRRARDGRRCAFPRETVKASTILPDLDKYKGPPLEYRPHGGDRLRSRRAAAVRHDRRHAECRAGECARHPQHPRRALGHLPGRLRPAPVRGAASRRARRRCARCSASCPDALERAAELDATYGRNPDLEKMPMYGVVFSFKDPFDTKDMRSTGGGDARYDIDFPARDHVLVEQLRNKGAIIFAKAVNTEYNGRAGDPGGRHKPGQGAALDARLSAQHLGRQSRRTPTTRRARPRSARARARACRSAPIW